MTANVADKPTKEKRKYAKRGRPAQRTKDVEAKKDGLSKNNMQDVAIPEYMQYACWQLRRLGYSIQATAQALNLSPTTIKKYDMIVDKFFGDLPAVRLMIDAVATKIPRAVAVYDKCLDLIDSPDAQSKRLARDTARDILISTKVLQDRQTVELPKDADADDSELVAEAERYLAIARSKESASTDNGRTKA